MAAHNSANMMTLSALGYPERSNSPTQPIPPAGCPVQVFHLLWTNPKSWKGFFPKPTKSALYQPTGREQSAILQPFPLPITNANTYVLISLLSSPQAWHVPKRPWEERLTWHAGGAEISALRKRCNKSPPVRERCPQKHTAHEQTVSASFSKLTPKW